MEANETGDFIDLTYANAGRRSTVSAHRRRNSYWRIDEILARLVVRSARNSGSTTLMASMAS